MNQTKTTSLLSLMKKLFELFTVNGRDRRVNKLNKNEVILVTTVTVTAYCIILYLMYKFKFPVTLGKVLYRVHILFGLGVIENNNPRHPSSHRRHVPEHNHCHSQLGS